METAIMAIIGTILKAIPWQKLFGSILEAVLENEKAREAFLKFIASVPQNVPVQRQDEYLRLRKEIFEKFKKESGE